MYTAYLDNLAKDINRIRDNLYYAEKLLKKATLTRESKEAIQGMIADWRIELAEKNTQWRKAHLKHLRNR